MSASQRRKGAEFEREVATELAHMFGREVKRTLGQARDGGADIEVGGLLFECKRRKSLKVLYGWMRQALSAVAGRMFASGFVPVPALVIRADGEDALVVVRLQDLSIFTTLVRNM